MYPDVERACRNACTGNQSFSREEFMCSGKYIDEAAFIRAYGIDPCEGGAAMEDILDPLNDREAQEKQFQDIAPFLWGVLLLILVALAVLYFLRRKG